MRTGRNIRYRSGVGWIPVRKRIYLYWFKFLQEAEKAPHKEFEVDWSKYRGWGGANVVLGQKFDDWWEDRWFDLFGSKERLVDVNKKFPINTIGGVSPRSDPIRIRLLVFQNRNIPPDMTPRSHTNPDGAYANIRAKRRGGKTLSIARKVIQLEKGKTTPLAGMDLEAGFINGMIEQEVQSCVGRYLRDAKKIAANVCEGRFP